MSSEMALEDGVKSDKLNSIDGVKFTKANEDVDMSRPTTKLIGLTKEQLEQYRNDPFWRAIRYGLFILFWLVWLAMFVGAILIVVLSPKCAVKIEPKWHENAVAYQIFTPTFKDADGDGVGDLKGIEEKLNDLRKVGVNAIWPTPIVKTDKDVYSPEEVIDILTVDPRFGNDEDLKSLIDSTHKAGLYFIADLPLTVSASVNNWSKGKNFTVGSNPSRASLLDIGNMEVQNKLLDAAKKFLNLGVDGLFLADYGLSKKKGPKNVNKSAKELIERLRNMISSDDIIKQNEVLIFTESNQEANQKYSQFSEDYHILSLTERQQSDRGLFDNVIEKAQKSLELNGTIRPMWTISNLYTPRVDQQLKTSSSSMNELKTHPFEASTLLTMIQLFLPGPVSILYGEELALPSATSKNDQEAPTQRVIQQWKQDARNFGFSGFSEKLFFPIAENAQRITFKEQFANSSSPLRVFKQMNELRKREVLQRGEWRYKPDDNNGLYVFARFIPDSLTEPIYILAVNAHSSPKKLWFGPEMSKMINGKSPIMAEVKVTFNTMQPSRELNLKSETLTIDPFSGLILFIH